MSLAIYDGIILLSPSYCNRKLQELRDKQGLVPNIASIENNEKSFLLAKQISQYEKLMKKINKYLEELCDEERVRYIASEIVTRIEASKATRVSISFQYVSEYTIGIKIDNIFSTELTCENKVFDECWYPNEYYDGYYDIAEYVVRITPTSFFEEVISKVQSILQNQLAKVSFSILKR